MSTDPPGRKPEPPAEDDDATRVIVPGSPADGPSKEDYRRTVMGTGPGDPFGTAVPTGRPSDDGADPRGLHEDDEAHHEPIDDSATAVSAPQPDPQVVTASPVGTVLNENYKIERLIGAGGMGEVYEGEHLFTGNRVAIKMILEQLSKDETIVSLFRREARILFELADDAIVRYLDSFYHSASGRYCLVTQFIEGTPLSDHLTRYGALDEARGRLLMARLARGLQKAHDRGVVHRDLSPDNVMLRDGKVERAALIDFGIATAEDMGDATLFGKFAGKFRYVSPEQLGLFGGKVGPHTDIYGLALLMAAALRGTALDMGQSVAEAVDARRSVPALDGIPASLAPVLTQMLAPDPAHRPVSMDEVLTLLEVTSGGNEETVIQTPGTRPPSVPPAPQVTQPTAAPVTGRLALPPGASQPPAGSAPPTMPTGGLGHAPLGAPVDPTSPGAAPFAATTA
ncbi:serine/threonine protein kinase, partial [Jannaschia aquimarina]